MRQGLIAGHNVDEVRIHDGMRELEACGYTNPKTLMVIEYALIYLTCWYRVLAAAISSNEKQPTQ